ncbi:MAG TPA: cytidine deaminase [Treponema sp.]|nr:cytidine deaminase [Treponema sp.]
MAVSEKELSQIPVQELVDKAFAMLSAAYTPYSHWKVGAALLSADGRIWGGCNIENAAYSPTNCAERTAFFKAVSEGEREFKAIAIVGGHEGDVQDYCSPCGVCRQVMMEFCNPGTFIIIQAKSRSEYRAATLAELLPEGFGPATLGA